MQNDDNNTTTMISRNFAKIAAVLLLLFMATVARAQILDGTVQSARYRVSMPLTLNFVDGSINSSPYVGLQAGYSSIYGGCGLCTVQHQARGFRPPSMGGIFYFKGTLSPFAFNL